MSGKVDFVIAWVNGNDENWIKEKNKYVNIESGDNSDNRYRDWDLLRYWFRGVEKFAPWVNKIHFVTWGHLPEWLNAGHEKLNIVKHEDYIPQEYLPTFNSDTIELNFHRIAGLEEQFVYFNDDMFLLNKVKPEDFFIEGKPCDAAVLTALQPIDDIVTNIIFNNIMIINRHFKKPSSLYNRFTAFCSWKYGFYNMKSLLMLPFNKYSMFLDFHCSTNFLKTTFQTVWDRECAILDLSCRHKFRNPADVNQWLFRYWQLAEGKFHVSKPIGKYYCIGDRDLPSIIKNQKYKVVCCNDVIKDISFAQEQTVLKQAFQAILPVKSHFEK